MAEFNSCLVQLGVEKYLELLVNGGFDSMQKLKSASDGHLKYLGIPMGIRKKISLSLQGENNVEGPTHQPPTATGPMTGPSMCGALRKESKPLWSAASGTGTSPSCHWEHLISLSRDLDKENSIPLDQVPSMSMHQVQRLHREEQERNAGSSGKDRIGNSIEGKERSGPDFLIVGTREATKPQPVFQLANNDAMGVRDQARHANDEALGRLRALRAELRAAEDQVTSLKKMVTEVEREISAASHPRIREVIEID